ncbi:MAG: heavy-metal-associated domain-containing protein [Planctomycetota bacterium]|jgi:copper chaperone CopZ
MNSTCTAIIHLRDSDSPQDVDQQRGRSVIESVLPVISGVKDVSYEPRDRFITVRFDAGLTSLAELVRAIEDAGSPVSGVAQRPNLSVS